MVPLFFFFIGLLGLSVGSFLNVVILRSVENKKPTGRSKCPHCHHELQVLDLVPIFSFVFLKGKCRYCHQKISSQYPLVEGGTFLLFLITTFLLLAIFKSQLSFQFFFNLVIYLFATSVLIAIFVTDLRWGLIPNKIIIPATLILLLLKVVLIAASLGITFFSLSKDSLLGKYLLPPYSDYLWVLLSRQGFGLLYDLGIGLGIGLVFYLLIVFTKGRAMGGGDIKLGVFVGLLNGWPFALVTLLLSFILGALVSVFLLLIRKKKFGQTIPFGPFLAVSSLITLFWGEQIFNWYASLMK